MTGAPMSAASLIQREGGITVIDGRAIACRRVRKPTGVPMFHDLIAAIRAAVREFRRLRQTRARIASIVTPFD